MVDLCANKFRSIRFDAIRFQFSQCARRFFPFLRYIGVRVAVIYCLRQKPLTTKSIFAMQVNNRTEHRLKEKLKKSERASKSVTSNFS